MKKILTARQMRECDYSTISAGTPSAVLMERAAMSVYKVLLERFDPDYTLIVCGSGNNGGDGLLLAQIMHHNNYKCDIWYVGEGHTMSEETERRYNEALDLGIRFVDVPDIDKYTVIVDAIFGTGLNSAPQGLCEDAIVAMNSAPAPILAIDIPSGISSDTGKSIGESIRADVTVTMEAYKRGHAIGDGIDASGLVICADLGIDTSVATDADGIIPYAIDEADLSLIPRRKRDSHKGDYGRVLVIAGSIGMSGAAYLCACAAYRTGAGIVEILTVEENRTILQGLLPEAIITTYSQNSLDVSTVISAIERANIIVMGPGIGTGTASKVIVKEVYENCTSPLIVDADALNITASENLSYPTDVPVIVTPHPGELSRLTGRSVKALSEDSWNSAIEYARNNDIICVSKFARTVITDGENIFINMSGGPSLSKGGSGDVLAGIIAGMLCNGLSPIGAASIGAYVHGKSGDLAADKFGDYSCLARDIIDNISCIMKNAGGKE
ncbi:MAG: NAD(P)H-hydrate dehydratase [Clostridia bacterium]|nr:NAD(P)H-hydrate dehydratase [Clostridia bacterium]